MYDLFISYNTKDQAIADRTYERLTQAGYRCFLCTHNLKDADWAGDIMNSLEQSKGFVVLVSQNAVISNEVMKEVTLATRYSRYIFPLRIDEAPMDRAMEYHLAPFTWISAVIPPLELRLDDLIHRIQAAFQGENSDGNYNESRVELVNQIVMPRAEFTGREAEIAEIHQRFEEGSNCVFVSGMGGMGKSELARSYAKTYRNQYKTVIMAVFTEDLLQLIIDDRAIPIRGIARGNAEEAEDYYVRKIEVLKELVTPRTLLIIDNFDVEEDPYLEDLMTLNCHLLFTTRTNFEDYGFDTVLLKQMNTQTELLPLMERLDHKYLKEEERQAAMEIIVFLDGHTYAVSLTACQMKAGHIKPGKMLDALRAEGLRYQSRSTFSRSMKGERSTAYGFIKMLFDFSKLESRETDLLKMLCCAPEEGVDIDLFMELAEIDDFEEIRRLINLNWIFQDEEADTIRLHMLVRELIEDEFQLDIFDVEPYFLKLRERMQGAWNFPYEEKMLLKPSIMAMLRRFPEPKPEHLNVWDGYSTFAWMMNEFDISEQSALKQYELSCRVNGEISLKTSFLALRVAAVYHNRNDIQKAGPWYRKGKEIALAIGGDSYEAATAIFKVARNDMQNGNLEAASRGCQESLDMMERIQAPTGANAYLEFTMAKIYTILTQALLMGGRGELEEAIALVEKQYKIKQRESILIIAILLLLFSYVFHYGMILQIESDETL